MSSFKNMLLLVCALAVVSSVSALGWQAKLEEYRAMDSCVAGKDGFVEPTGAKTVGDGCGGETRHWWKSKAGGMVIREDLGGITDCKCEDGKTGKCIGYPSPVGYDIYCVELVQLQPPTPQIETIPGTNTPIEVVYPPLWQIPGHKEALSMKIQQEPAGNHGSAQIPAAATKPPAPQNGGDNKKKNDTETEKVENKKDKHTIIPAMPDALQPMQSFRGTGSDK
eukprot:GFYU01003726.1.p1 GENE.GFYU01003726.1~~GFYU01003726.1.p1  ORF type:complete len:223 (-),score=81.54 GFYU01003726.1:97-765(-)